MTGVHPVCRERVDALTPQQTIGEVAKRSNAADCKSVASGLRRFESFPRHQPSLLGIARSFGWQANLLGSGQPGWQAAVPALDSRGELYGDCDRGLADAARGLQRVDAQARHGAVEMSMCDGGPARRSARSESCERVGGSNSVVESQPSKLLVAGSIPVSRSSLRSRLCRELRLAGQVPLAFASRASAARLSSAVRSQRREWWPTECC